MEGTSSSGVEERSAPRLSSDLGGVARLWGRSFGPSVLVALAAVAAMAVALVPLYIWATNASLALGYRDVEQVTPRQFTYLLIAALLPLAVVLVLLGAAVFGGVAIVAARRAQDLPARPMGAFRAGLRSSPRLVLVLALTLGTTVAAFSATPFLVVGGVVALAVTPLVRVLQRRWASLPWPATRTLVVVAVPFGAAAALVVRWSLVLPAVVLERGGIRSAFTRSIELTRSHATRIAVVAVAFFLIPLAVLALINRQVLIDATSVVGPQLVSTVAGLLVLTLGVAAMAYLFTELAEPADLAFVELPPPGRDRSVGALVVVALLAGAVPVSLAIARPTTADAAPASFIVNDLGDAPDANPGDSACDTGTGSCTLRAALDEANQSSGEVIGFGVSGTIAVGSTLRIASPLTIDGSGRSVAVDGGGSVSVLSVGIEVSGGGSATLRSLTISGGYDGSTGGGAIWNSGASGGEGLVLDGVTVRDTVTAAGAMFGGAVVNLSKMTVRNSTFSGNQADAATDGSDLASVFSGTTTISHSTFAGSSGSSAVASTGDDPIAITNSIVTGPAFACSGSFTGSGNVTTDDAEVCPGTFGIGSGELGLTPLADNGGSTPTVRLLPNGAAVDAGGAAACAGTDQRGATRPKGAGCDAGAYELDPATSTSLVVTPDRTSVGGTVTLDATVTASVEPVTPTGEVELFDGTTSLGTVDLDGTGSATLAVTTLGPGPHDLTATYRPDAALAGSTSPVRVVTIDRAAPTVTLTSSGSPTAGGESVTFFVRVDGAAGAVPTGSVTLRDGSTAVQTVTLDGTGRAQVTTSALAGGPHVMVADYAGDLRYAAASSSALAHEVVGGTTTVLRAPPAPTVYGNDAVFEVEVTAAGGGRTPTGTVTLEAGPTTVGFADLDAAGKVQIPVTVLPPGTSSVVAAYEGDGYNGASVSAPVTHDVAAADTATTLTVRPSPSSVFGNAVTVDVAVTAAGTTAIPSGTVTIYDGATVVNAVVLQADGTFSSTLPLLGAGTHALRAQYDGPAGFRSSSSGTVAHQVARAASAVSLTAGSPTSVTGELVSLTASVTSSNSPRVPVGAVTFRDGSTVLGTVALDAAGKAQLDTRALATGGRALTASFDGGTDFAVATSPTLAHTVTRAEVIVTVQAAPTRTWFGSLVTIEVLVAAAAPGSGMPTGSVTIRDGATVLGTPVLDEHGRASIPAWTIAVGERTLRAEYGGDSGFQAGTGTATQTIDPDTTTVTVLTSEPEQLYGHPVTLTAAVVGTGVAKPTGSVTFTAAGRTLGTAVLDASGRADVTVADLPVGSLLVQAAYAGDGNFLAGTGLLVQQVSAAPTSTSLVVSPMSPSVTDLVTLTATVTAPGATLAPSGTVGFYDNDALIGTAAIGSDGTATFRQTFDRSSHELQARFTATPSWKASASGRVAIAPGRIGSTLALGAQPSAAVVGAPVTLVAAIEVPVGAPAPTGVIHFTDASGTLGSATLVDGVATLAVTAPSLPGSWIVNGWYPGDLNYAPIAPTAATVTVDALPTTVSVVSAPNPGYALDGPVTVRARVTSASGVPVSGTVRFASDSGAPIDETAVIDAEGIAQVTMTDVPAGTWTLQATYLPASGSAFAGSSGTSTHRSVKRSSLVEISAEGLKAGRATKVTATVTDPGGSERVPSGTVLISAGAGLTCTASAPTGSCNLVLPTVGPVTLTAAYRGDGRFLGDDDVLLAAVTASVPVLRVSSPTRTWVTGDPIAIDWTLPASVTGTVTVRSPFGVACEVPAASSGSCTATVPFAERGATFSFDVAYSGDAVWDAAQGAIGGTLKACYPVPFTASPVEGGTVTGPEGNCNGGTGFVDGTSVTATAEPAEGYVLSRWIETDRTTLGYRFVVGEATRSATAVFALDCVTLAYRGAQAPNVDPTGSAAGQVQLAPAPDCGQPDQVDPASGTTTSEYRRGTTVQATAVSSTPDRGEFKGWVVNEESGSSSYPVDETIGLTLTGDVDLTANFGARCYRPEVLADGDGTGEIATAPNCFDTTGSGYVLQTEVTVEATPGAFHFVGPMRLASGSVLPSNAFRVLTDDPVTVRFDPCRKLTTGATGSGRGSVRVSVDSTCPGKEPGYYTPGEISLEAIPAEAPTGYFGLTVEGDQFKRWESGGAIPPQSRANPVRLDMSEDREVTAVFTSPTRCAGITLASGSPGWIGDLEVHQDSKFECRGAGEYVQGEPFTLTSSTLQGAPLTQWQIKGLGDYEAAALSGKSTAAPGRTRHRQIQGNGTVAVAPMYGNVTATAYACVAVNAEASVLGTDGFPIEGAEPPESFVLYDTAPTCPGTGNGWRVGDQLGYFAGAQLVGWEFVRWQGAADGREPEGSLAIDGAAPSITLGALYRPICFTLAVTPEAHTYRGLDPNCPTADPSESRYIGGTTVALHTSGGGEVWVGWEGDVDRRENPTWVYVDEDSTAHARWRDKTTNEEIEDFFTDVGDALAVGAKKLLGVGIMAVNAMINTTTTTVLGIISLAATAIDAIAGALGAPSDGKFKEVMTGIQQTANLWSSPFSCGAEWAFAGATDGENTLDGTGGDWKDAIKDPKKMGEKLKDYRSAIEEVEDSSEGYMRSIKKFGVRANTLRSVGTVGLTAVGIGTSIASDDMGWDDSAGEAWGSEAGRAFFTCMEKSIPDYWNVPSLGYEDP